MKSQATIGTQLIGGFGAMLALLLGMGAASLYSTENLSNDVRTTAAVTARKLDLAGEVSRDFAAVQNAVNNVLLTAANRHADPGAASLADQKRKEVESNLTELLALMESGREAQAADALAGNLTYWSQSVEEILRSCAAGNLAAAKASRDANRGRVAAMAASADELLSAAREGLAAAAVDAAADRARTRWTLGGALAVSLLVSAAAFGLVLRINRALRQVGSELGAAASQVAAASEQVSASSHSLAQGSSEQAASLEETSASTEQINAMARRTTEGAMSAAGLMAQSQRRIADTNQSLDRMVVAMTEISASSDRIARIIKTIDEIAFQTNILALNAAVEAARAGEAGLGFAVVSDEVRNLAQRCALAAKDTEALIEESMGKARDGKQKVDEVAVAIRTITGETQRVQALVDEMSMGSQEQSRGIAQIASAVGDMQQVTQRTAATAEEGASAAAGLEAQAEVLTRIVHRLTELTGQGR